jgi:hypothetical protein
MESLYAAEYAPVPSIACVKRTARQLQGVDSISVPRIKMSIRGSEFSPMIMRLTKGHACVLRLCNCDDVAHIFGVPEFFDNIAVAAVTMDNDIMPTSCSRVAVEMQLGQPFEMQFLAANDGVYGYCGTGGEGHSIGNLLNTAAPSDIIRTEAQLTGVP